MPVTFVLGIDGDRRVAEHGLGTGGGYHDVLVAAGDRVADVPEVALLFGVNDL